MAELKTKRTKKSVPKYFSQIEPDWKREESIKLNQLITEATGLKPAIWGDSIVGYGSYYYEHERSNQKGDWPLVGFSARKTSFSVYIMPGFKNYERILERLGKHKHSVGCLYIKKLSDIDETVLKELIKQSVEDMRGMYEKTTY